MKKFYSFLFFIILILNGLSVSAQNTITPVLFAAGNFITGNNIQNQNFQKTNLDAAAFNENYYVLVQFSKLPWTYAL